MIVRSIAPLRLGLAGGGTDVSPFCDEYGGCILNVTINMFAHCVIETTNDNKIIIDSYDSNGHGEYESISKLDINDNKFVLIKGVYNRIVKDYNNGKPLSFKIMTYTEAPVGSGLGSSSTMVVCIIKAFVELLNLPLGEYEISKLAYEIERVDLGFEGGKQDQYAATFGGFNFMEFGSNNLVIVNPLRVKNWIKDEIESEIILYYTGKSRESANIIQDQIKNTKAKNEKSLEGMMELKQSAVDMKNALLQGNFDGIANILNKSWESKKKMAKTITNPLIDETYNFIMENGAKAAKISGAGGGGFMMIICDPYKKFELVEKLKEKGGMVLLTSICERGARSWTIDK